MPRRTQREVPGQLPMFMTPREIKAQYSTHVGDRKYSSGPNRFGRYETHWHSEEATWAKKQDENKSTGLTESVKLSGVQFPVGLGVTTDTEAVSEHNRRSWAENQINAPMTGKPMITGGHHRIEAAFQTAPDTPIPVIHHEDILEAQGYNVPKSHKEFATVRSQGGTAYRMPKMVGQTGYETQKIAQPWGPYR